LQLSEAALDKLGEAGFDPVYGARPLKRAIQQHIENPLAQAILSGQFLPGDTIAVEVQDGDMQFSNNSVSAA
jgi:ATP-dependent Clp protease ATP-binding subunit ClpB